ncbi:MAG TPA: putative sugar nucleotidyl transferase [Puia sp.]|nr:putative sugar nucleotidyl transferase [Puia sp.]
MNEIILDDAETIQDFFPFTLTRSVADIRIGITTIREKWEKFFGYAIRADQPQDKTIPVLPSNIIPDKSLIIAIQEKNYQQYISSVKELKTIRYPWHIFQLNDENIRSDFKFITKERESAKISSTNKVIQSENIFIEPGAMVEHCFLNASKGPIYIGRNAEIMEGAMIRGPFALCEGAVVKMGTTIYGATTIGPYSTVGGEIKNSVIFGYSNKGHDGYLGDSVIGTWCNLGAGSSSSNMKNNAGEVNVWNPHSKKFISAGLKCGLLMGDYSQSAINTSFNTGTVVGVCCNVFGNGLTPKYIPDFSWGYTPISKYLFENALKDMANWKKLKNQLLSNVEISTLKHIFEQS